MGASLNLLKYIKAGPSLDLNHPKVSEKQLANVFESLIGAMRLDGGFEPCINLIYNTVGINGERRGRHSIIKVC